MGLSPVLGRLTRPSDDGKGAPPVMMLTHEFWKKRFGGDPSIVGKKLRVGGKAVTVVGVLQPAPYFPDAIDALMNMVISEHHLSAMMVQGRTHRMTEMIARLAPGATVEQARAEVAAVHARVQREHPEAYDPGSHYRVAVTPFKEVLGESARLTLWLLMGAAAFVLDHLRANVANLTLMRGVRREHELVVRAALGAGVARLRRLLLAENLVLTLMGARARAGASRSAVCDCSSRSPRATARAPTRSASTASVLGFTLALVGRRSRAALVRGVAAEGRATLASLIAGGRAPDRAAALTRQRLQHTLVVAQIAVSVVLLAGAGLLTRTMMRLSEVTPGSSTEEVLTMEVPLLDFGGVRATAADATAKQMYDRMRREIRALPGVNEVGVGSTMPLRSVGITLEVKAEGQAARRRRGDAARRVPHGEPGLLPRRRHPAAQGREFTSPTDRRARGAS